MTDTYNSSEYKRSRKAYTWQYTIEYFVSILVADAFWQSFLLRYFVQASAIKNSIGGIFGFGASILGSKILEYVQSE